MTVFDYLRPRLFDPLGIENPVWGNSPQGITLGGVGLLIRTEDIARFGSLYLHKGMWQGRQLVPAEWVAAATSLQIANGSNPESDWDQGYGYQFWRCRHNAFRGDGAFGQYCLVLPEVDAVVVITSGVRDMQAVMNLVWDSLLPAMHSAPLKADPSAHRQLETKLSGLTVPLPSGRPTSSLGAMVSGRWYGFPENERGIRAIALETSGESPALLVRGAAGETRTPVGTGAWAKSRNGFTDGINQFLTVPTHPLLAVAGAWTADDLFTLKLLLYETPYHDIVTLRFDGDRLLLDAEHHVSFGPAKEPQLIGQAKS